MSVMIAVCVILNLSAIVMICKVQNIQTQSISESKKHIGQKKYANPEMTHI